MSYVKGALKLKGAAITKDTKNKPLTSNLILGKRLGDDELEKYEVKVDKKVKLDTTADVNQEEKKEENKTENNVTIIEGEVEEEIEAPQKPKVYKTEYEKRVALQKEQKLKGKIETRLKQSHRDRVEEYNKNLSKIPEHFDIPKVGPG